MYDSAYRVMYDYDTQCVIMIDTIADAESFVLPFAQFERMNVTFFGKERAQAITIAACASRPLFLSWKHNLVSVEAMSTDWAQEFLKRNLSIDTINMVTGADADPLDDPEDCRDYLTGIVRL